MKSTTRTTPERFGRRIERAAEVIRESKVETHFCDRVKALGGDTRKVGWIGRRNAPDRWAFFPDARPNFWCECKRPKKDATAAQAREHARMRASGEIVVVLDTIAKVDAYLAAYEEFA